MRDREGRVKRVAESRPILKGLAGGIVGVVPWGVVGLLNLVRRWSCSVPSLASVVATTIVAAGGRSLIITTSSERARPSYVVAIAEAVQSLYV